jgi:PAS domain S-box-containing protein
LNGDPIHEQPTGEQEARSTTSEYVNLHNEVGQPENFLHSLPEAVIVTDRQGRIHDMNLAAKRLLGEPDTNLAINDWPQAFGLYRDDGTGYLPAGQLPPVRALQGDTNKPTQTMILRGKTALQERRISMSAGLIRSRSGETDGVTTLIHEIPKQPQGDLATATDASHAESLNRLLDLIAENANDVDRIAAALASLTSEVVGDLGAVMLIDPHGTTLSLSAFRDADAEVAQLFKELAESSVDYNPGQSLEETLKNPQESLRIPSGEQPESLSQRMFGRFIEHMEIPGMLMVPLIGRTGPMGAISIFRHKGGQAYTTRDRSFLIDVSNRTAPAIENCRLFDSLQAEISARQFTAQALDISEQRFKSIFESTSLGIKVLDLTGNILQTNSAYRKIIGYPEYEILGRRFYDFLHPADIARAVSMFQKLKAEGVSALRFQHRAIHKNGSTVWVNAVFSAVRNGGDDESLAFIVSILEDVTDQKMFESELVELKTRLQNTLELERLRLAHELHDGPMQELYSVIYEIEELREKADTQDKDSLGNVSQNIQGVLQELRATAKELRPPTISQFGLEKTIRSYVGDLQEKHPELLVHLSLARDRQLLPEDVRLALFRIFQQSMSNIVRHAHATEARVRFTFDAEEARLEISDNGKGFQVPSSWIELVREGHYGLAGTAERVNALGGTFVVESQKPAGTTVRVVIPWKEHLD